LNLLTLRPILPHAPQAATTATANKMARLLQARGEARIVGEIEAVDEREAIEIAAKEFKQLAKKLMAVRRR
jgi:hypothetical protein